MAKRDGFISKIERWVGRPASPGRPFAQLPFEEVPELPRLPHPYFEVPSRELRFSSRPFGPVQIHLREFGDPGAPPLLLVHGFMTTSYSWRYVLAPLARHFRVLAPDLVGCGRRSKPVASYHPDCVAELIGELMRQLGVRGAPVIGNSLGGYLAMRLALRDASAMERLVVVHAPGLPTLRMHLLTGALAVLPGSEALVRKLVARDPERWVHEHVHYYDETLKSREEHREYAAPLRTPEGLAAFHRMLGQTLSANAMKAFEEALVQLSGRFPIPLRLAYATEDPMVPPRIGRKLHELLPSAELVEVERASHFMHVDAPERFLAATLPFLGVND